MLFRSLCKLQSGDLIYMGTPDGVAIVVAGDTMDGSYRNCRRFTLNIA